MNSSINKTQIHTNLKKRYCKETYEKWLTIYISMNSVLVDGQINKKSRSCDHGCRSEKQGYERRLPASLYKCCISSQLVCIWIHMPKDRYFKMSSKSLRWVRSMHTFSCHVWLPRPPTSRRVHAQVRKNASVSKDALFMCNRTHTHRSGHQRQRYGLANVRVAIVATLL